MNRLATIATRQRKSFARDLAFAAVVAFAAAVAVTTVGTAAHTANTADHACVMQLARR